MHTTTEELLQWYAEEFDNESLKQATAANISRALSLVGSVSAETVANGLIDIYTDFNRTFNKELIEFHHNTIPTIRHSQGAIRPFRSQIRKGLNACNEILSNLDYFEQQIKLKPFERDTRARNILQRARFGLNNEGLVGCFLRFIHSFIIKDSNL
jgi:hypothetical protein